MLDEVVDPQLDLSLRRPRRATGSGAIQGQVPDLGRTVSCRRDQRQGERRSENRDQ